MINNDPRYINNGSEIPTAGGYAGQPSIVVLSDGIFDNGGDVFEWGWRFIPRQLSFISPVKSVDDWRASLK